MDFGLNPEHPPVVKMLAAAPLLSMPLKVPEVRNRFFMHEAFSDGFFGTGAAFIALTLVVFEPNLLAHGARVTTDAGLSCFMFATMYAFYRYVKAPSAWRLAVVDLAAGLTLATKHTGILVIPTLALLAICELIRSRLAKKRFLDGRGIKECWFAYFGQGVLEPHYYGIPSKPHARHERSGQSMITHPLSRTLLTS